MRFTLAAASAAALLLSGSSILVKADECSCPPQGGSYWDGSNSINTGISASNNDNNNGGASGNNWSDPWSQPAPIRQVPKVKPTKKNLQKGTVKAIEQLQEKKVIPAGALIPSFVSYCPDHKLKRPTSRRPRQGATGGYQQGHRRAHYKAGGRRGCRIWDNNNRDHHAQRYCRANHHRRCQRCRLDCLHDPDHHCSSSWRDHSLKSGTLVRQCFPIRTPL